MDERYRALAPAEPPKSEAQCAATRWHKAKDRLGAALQRSNEAQAILQEAQKDEQSAWNDLETAAGRSTLKGYPVQAGSLGRG